MADYVFSELADQDLEDISYYTTLYFGEGQARAYRASIDQSAMTIANFPSIGRPYMTKDGKLLQKFNVGEHSLFYQPNEDGVIIVRVLHCKMDFDRHLDK